MNFKLNTNFLVGNDFIQAFSAIPQSVRHLDLSHNHLSFMEGECVLAQVFAAIPKDISKLILVDNNLGKKTGFQLTQMFSAIPKSVIDLDLSHNNFGFRTAQELIGAFSMIPCSVKQLNLSHNNLGYREGTELALFFSCIPDSVSDLDLSWNNLEQRNGDELAEAFRTLPITVKNLDLKGNYLGHKTKLELEKVFEALPATLESFDLNANEIFDKTGLELVQIFLILPTTITMLDKENKISPAEYIIQKLIPNFFTVIHSNPFMLFSDLRDTPEQRESLQTSIRPDYEISSYLMFLMIECFKKHQHPLGFFVTALLLDGGIQSGNDRLNAYDRLWNAIPFYRRAACDVTLKPLIESMLWYKKMAHDKEDDKELNSYLQKFRLHPHCATFFEFKDGIDMKSNPHLQDINNPEEVLPEVSFLLNMS